ncbi:type II methionyl aminopeptidase [Candidatus Woesearchaeota archaeon]|jgi:methionyl aminopeptidase|nr:type II methionyl aminopeptidase [Candidatus Woesearchaeota archaeon]MBT5273132.1 type II methionyl aminopeptidase [Candidatus Woesearchaeota archaeon]MBT6041635.1 type II methionyl aminopeptidase [Candidatus Woesearchaeota archaeon]MBT6337553.1 type II methionyl aminopeptidase [Candidatus Woesearchaeota archaeon]MBT7927046.1 type II methionyl aminopeptidase [Candidatus Woesearchaeota archaeon]
MNAELEEYKDWITAGKIASDVREYSKEIIKPGVKLLDVANKIEDKIRELGAIPAFPVNLSSDNFAAHYTPSPDDETIIEKQILKVDVGVCYKGAIGDTAFTLDLSNQNSELIEASRKAVENAIKILKVGTTLGEIGKVIEDTIVNLGFQPIRNLSGHGLDLFQIHTKPSIPNYDNGDTTEIKKGMIFAIEPFATNGGGKIREGSHPNIYMQTNNRPIRDMITRKIFEEIKQFKQLPFSTRDLVAKFPLNQVKMALKRLMMANNIHEYPPLPEVSDGLVSQHEHTILMLDEPVVLTK